MNYYSWGSNSIYNAAQFTLRKRSARGFFYRLNYSFSKSIDDASQFQGSSDGGFPNALDSRNLKLDRARSDFDIGHAFAAVFSRELPVGRGRRFLRGSRGLANTVLGGWQLSGTARAYTGQPFTIRTADVDQNLGESERPNRIRKGVPVAGAFPGQRGADFPWFELTAFEQVPCANPSQGGTCLERSEYGFLPFDFGNAGRNTWTAPAWWPSTWG